MNIRRPVVVFLVMLIATVALAAVVVYARGSFVHEQIVVPISYLLWIIGLLLRGTPQVLFWGILLVIALVMFMRSLAAAPQRHPGAMPIETNYGRRPRLRFWVRQLLMARDERYRRYMKEGLGHLAVEILAYQRGMTVNQYQQLVDSKQEQPPENLVPFLEARRERYTLHEPLELGLLIRRLQRFWNNLLQSRQGKPNHDGEFDELVDYLEKQMDVE